MDETSWGWRLLRFSVNKNLLGKSSPSSPVIYQRTYLGRKKGGVKTTQVIEDLSEFR